MSQTRQLLQEWAKQNPGYVAGLEAAISRAEGTWRGNAPGYNILFGGGQFKGYERHPDRVIRTPGYASAAAGAFQFMPDTWKGVASAIGAKDFSPENQRLGMLHLTRQRLLPVGGLAAISKAGKLTPELQARLAPEWASFPTLQGVSAYGQPVKRAGQISAWFDEAASNAANTAQAPSQTPPSTDQGLLQGFVTALTGGKSSEEKMQDEIQKSLLQDVLAPRQNTLPLGFLLNYIGYR
jgi:muramidase (phage lysozyme)